MESQTDNWHIQSPKDSDIAFKDLHMPVLAQRDRSGYLVRGDAWGMGVVFATFPKVYDSVFLKDNQGKRRDVDHDLGQKGIV